MDARRLKARADARLPMFRSRLDGAHNRLDTVSPPGFVAWSGGKDSTVAALIAVEHWGQDFPVVAFRCGLEFPETVAYQDELAAMLGWNFHVVELGDYLAEMVRSGAWDHRAVADPTQRSDWSFHTRISGPAEMAHERFGPLMVWGIRSDESKKRRMMLGSHGRQGVVHRRDGTTTCAPLQRWTARDVWAAHAHYGVSWNPVYDRLEELGVAEVNQRVDVMVGANGTGQGRMGWLALGWPEEFRRLAAVLPRMREMA